jgi:uncharacterized membrane protein YeaQ/YmgE (transglycosylase-associated protein family)
MGIIMTLIVGGIIGWLASLVMGTNAQQGVIANIVVGIVGASFASWLFGDVLEIGGAHSAGMLHFPGIIWGVAGAAVLIGFLKLLRILR